MCVDDGVCTKKNYPKDFCENTMESVDGYPKYRRIDDGVGVTVKVHNVDVDNRWVVHTIHGYNNSMELTLMWKLPCQLNLSSICTNTYTEDMTASSLKFEETTWGEE